MDFLRHFLATNKDILEAIGILVQLALVFAAFYFGRANLRAADANTKMAEANNKMAEAAEAEVKLLKLQHAYSKAPVLHNTEVRHGAPWSLEYSNLTPNPAMRVTVFGRIGGAYMLSENTTIIGANNKQSFRVTGTSEQKFKQKIVDCYGCYLPLERIHSSPFGKFFESDNSGFFILYQDFGGRLHGTALVVAVENLPVTAENIYSGHTEGRTVPHARPVDQTFHPFLMQSENNEPNL